MFAAAHVVQATHGGEGRCAHGHDEQFTNTSLVITYVDVSHLISSESMSGLVNKVPLKLGVTTNDSFTTSKSGMDMLLLSSSLFRNAGSYT